MQKKQPLTLDPNRLFPPQPEVRAIARRLYDAVHDLPIISPHGHTDPAWFAQNQPFTDASTLLIVPDHYVFRMLYSQGVPLEALGIAPAQSAKGANGQALETDPRQIWRHFAHHYPLFQGTPSRLWLDHVFAEVFHMPHRLTAATADDYFDRINELLATEAFRPRALFEQFRIEVLTTTESPLDDLRHHQAIRASGWQGRVLTAYRPDPVIDPEHEGFASNLRDFGDLTGCDTHTWQGYLDAHRSRRAFFKQQGATSTDHGHPSAATADLPPKQAAALFKQVLKQARQGKPDAATSEAFRAQMLTEMARMSLEDGLVMQLHPGSHRNHNQPLFARFGRDKGADIPQRTDYVAALQPLLNAFGNEPALTLILFTLDETAYARELAPLAGHYPALKLGPPWWFHDSPEGIKRFRQQTTETAGFQNTVGFNDDTRAFLSIPARHDVARRADCAYLAELVADHRLPEDEAAELAPQLAHSLAKQAYRL